MALFPPPPAPLLSLVEGSINAVLRTDPATLHRLAEFSGRAVEIEAADTGLRLVLRIEADRIRVQAPGTTAADCSLSASSAVFMQLAMRPGDRSLLFGQRMNVHGDIELAGAIADCLGDLEVDPGALLEPVFGSVAAQGIGQMLGKTAGWLQRTGDHLRMDVVEYLENESDLPSRDEAQLLFTGIADARDAVERMAQRLQRLQARATQAGKAVEQP